MKALLIVPRAALVALMLVAVGAVARVHAQAEPAAAPPHPTPSPRRLEVPEPASMLLLGSGLVGLAVAVRRGLTRRD